MLPHFRLKTFAIAAGAAVLSFGLLGVWAWRDLVRDLPGRDALNHIGETAQSTLVYDASDRGVSTIFNQQRIDVPLEDVSTHFVQALISVEDQRFYEHGAVDPRRIFTAALADLARLRAAQGASTLTQQLARASFLTPRRTLRRKLQEIVLASRIERQYSKHDILQLYVNRVYFARRPRQGAIHDSADLRPRAGHAAPQRGAPDHARREPDRSPDMGAGA